MIPETSFCDGAFSGARRLDSLRYFANLVLVFVDQSDYPQIVPGLKLFSVFEVNQMKSRNYFLVSLVVLLAAAVAFGQGKGVDRQNQRITDNSSNKGAANNGTKQDVGTTGSGINFGKEKTPTHVMLPNPYRMTARRDVLMKAVADVMRDRKLILDEASSKPNDGIIVSQPYTFIKGAVVAKSELNRYGDIVAEDARSWTRGRYTITVEVQPIDGINSNVSVNAKIEGRTDGPSGAEWLTLQSTGIAEQEFLAALIENITGAAPTGAIKSRELDWKVTATVADTMTKIVSVDVTRNSLLINAITKSIRN
jgi:hypothetical protein